MNKNHEDIFLKINPGEQNQLKEVCDRYGIEYDESYFNEKRKFDHISWGILENTLIKFSPTNFLIHPPMTNSIDELKEYLLGNALNERI